MQVADCLEPLAYSVMDEFPGSPICKGSSGTYGGNTNATTHTCPAGLAGLLCIARACANGRANELWQTGLMAHALDTIPRRKENGNGE